jgi:CBS domain-containing protein
MKVHEIMSAHARCVGPDNTLVEAAGLMRELDVGALPVCEDDNLAGMVTDRDMVLRGTADGRDPNSTVVRDVMSPGVVFVFADQEVEEAGRVMEEKQIRRLPVLNREKRLIGIVSLGDIAITSNPAFSGKALREVSEPPNPTARQRRLRQASEPAGLPMPEVPGETRRRPGGRAAKRGGGAQRQPAAQKKSSRGTPARGRKRTQAGAARKTSGRSTTRSSRSRKTTARSGK